MPVKGTVKWFSSQKGYGFIACEGQTDVFAHYSDIVDNGSGFRFLERGAEVEFEIIPGEQGPRATHIVRTQKPETETPEET
ncbi:MAG TPA: cold shock domain-containing protein [Planctomycetota bacterium]|nr:cold shock domain-containing protein [Planctomycetota bacterium]